MKLESKGLEEYIGENYYEMIPYWLLIFNSTL